MRLSLKSLIIAWIFLVLIILGFLVKTYLTFNSDSVVTLLSEKVTKAIPGSSLYVGAIKYNFSINMNVKFENVKIKKKKDLIASIGEVEFKVPWWFLIIREGHAHINLKDVEVLVDDHLSIKKKLKKKRKSNALYVERPKPIKIEIPSDFLNVKYTLRAFNMKVQDRNSTRRYFEVSKMLIRNFQFDQNSAFEVNIPIVMSYKNKKHPGNLWIFGDITPSSPLWKMNFRGEFKSLDKVSENSQVDDDNYLQIDDFLIAAESTFDPQKMVMSSQLSFSLDKKPIGRGSLDFKNDQLTLQTEVTSLPIGKLGFLVSELKSHFFHEATTNAEGRFTFKKNLKDSKTETNGDLTFQGRFHYSNEESLEGEWKILLNQGRLDLSFISPRGNITYLKKMLLEASLSHSKEFSSRGQFIEEIKFEGLNINQIFSSPQYDWEIFHFLNLKDDASFTRSLSLKNCILENHNISGTFKWGKKQNQKLMSGVLGDQDSQVKILAESKPGLSLKNQIESDEKKVEVSFNKFSWYSDYSFLAPYFKIEKAETLNGQIQTSWTSSFSEAKSKIDLSAKNISNPHGTLTDFIKTEMLSFLKNKNLQKKSWLDDEDSLKDLSKFNIKLFSNSKKISLNQIHLENESFNKSLLVSGIINQGRQSQMKISQKQNKINKKADQKLNLDSMDRLKKFLRGDVQ